jgi:hypothetical protein
VRSVVKANLGMGHLGRYFARRIDPLDMTKLRSALRGSSGVPKVRRKY